MSQNPTYNDWSANEIELEAFDQVLNTWLNDLEVRAIILMILSSENIEQKVINEVKSSILKNDGELEDAKLAIHNNRFHVKASNKMKSVNWSDHIDDFEENVFQESSGPKIDFLELLWSGSQVIDLN
ncbi:hypothetical protein JCM21714_3632 [Gracilibacillus boraciitolerans JCM 21714]|uniref:Uncharacterized protein n=1 Tax=Gracilibacillus boraciitolerans JCM 21714 TaxID=1298598 RepID=W4VMR2_9BACI|nr:hypothetical protein [Gracilibacillus boraciitolerans]GAE94472.1 hypothetical protein JCM21714_3632 [Gracilibacillus boraciitolerans JCM 21714]